MGQVWHPGLIATKEPATPKTGVISSDPKLFTSWRADHVPRGSASKVANTAAAGASIFPYPAGKAAREGHRHTTPMSGEASDHPYTSFICSCTKCGTGTPGLHQRGDPHPQ